MLTRCVDAWKQPEPGAKTPFWTLIEKHKAIFMEPKYSSQMQPVIDAYSAKIEEPGSNGAMFLAVARGKVSEGLDFSDEHARAVVVTGLPYPNLADPKVRLKRLYMYSNTKCGNSDQQAVSGSAWYSQQAMRAVNQSIGRVIRHIKDYGAVILCDERFAPPTNRSMLSAWLRPSLKVYSAFGDFSRSLSAFFKAKLLKPAEPLPQPSLQLQLQQQIVVPSIASSTISAAASTTVSAAAAVTTATTLVAEQESKDAHRFIETVWCFFLGIAPLPFMPPHVLPDYR